MRLPAGSTRIGTSPEVPTVLTTLPSVVLCSGYWNSQFHWNAMTSTFTSGLARLVRDVVLRDGGEVEQHRHDHRRHDDEHELQREVVRRLTRQLLRLLAVEHHRPQDQAPHDDADDERGDHGPGPELAHLLGLRRDGLRPSEAQHLVRGATGGPDADQADQPGGLRHPGCPGALLQAHCSPASSFNANGSSGSVAQHNGAHPLGAPPLRCSFGHTERLRHTGGLPRRISERCESLVRPGRTGQP